MSKIASILDSVVPFAVGSRTALVALTKGVVIVLRTVGVPVPTEVDVALDALLTAFAVAHVVR
jgi:hypothetical protein